MEAPNLSSRALHGVHGCGLALVFGGYPMVEQRRRVRSFRVAFFAMVGGFAFAFTACDKAETPRGTACTSSLSCGLTEYCLDGVCTDAGACSGVGNWAQCADLVDGAGNNEGSRYACMDQQCTRQCIEDMDCAEGTEVCSDYGRCISFEGKVDAFVATDGAASAVRAGFGQALMHYPIGLSLGGYGSRMKANDGRYAGALSASQGQIGAQFARTIWLENDENTLILTRVPFIFPTGNIHERVARALYDALGEDLRDEFILVGTHTHSGPGRHWRLPTEAVMDLGMLGTGTFSQAAEDWFVTSITESVLAAHAALEPAKVGWKIVEAFDVDDVVARDRWESTPHFDLNRMLLIRVDKADGSPMAAIFSYATHATDNGSDYATDDVVGGAEIGLSSALSEDHGYYIPTLYMPEGGGSMSHASGVQGHNFPHSLGRAGGVMISKALSEFNAMTTKSAIGFRSRTYRFPITYERLGYAPMEYGARTRPFGGEYTYGAMLCGGKNAGDEDYTTHIEQGRLSCTPLSFLLHNRAPTLLMRAAITAIEFDGLSLVTLPGEATQELTWQALAMLRDQFERPTSHSWVWSYAQSHLLYLTPSNLRGAKPDVAGYLGDAPDDYPDHAFSFLQGGYETEMSPWGPRSGDYLLARASDAFAWLTGGVDPKVAPILPDQYTRIDQPEFPMDETASSAVAEIVMDMPSTVSYFSMGEFAWVGGDPGAEMPQAPLVELETQVGGQWQAVIGDDFRAYTNRDPRMASRLRVDQAPRYVWSVYYDFRPSELPTGTYRWKVSGHYLSAQTKARESYEVLSASFALEASHWTLSAVRPQAGVNGTSVIAYPVIQRLQIDADGERGKLVGSLQMYDWQTPTGVAPSPVCGADLSTVVCGDSTQDLWLETTLETVEGRQGVPVTRLHYRNSAVSPATIVDRVGNTWTISLTNE